METKSTWKKLRKKQSEGISVSFSLFKPLIKLEVPFQPPQKIK